MAYSGKWLLLAYKVPREPSAGRVYVWRKLKKLGAVAVGDAVWVLPSMPQTLEQFRWLAAEINEMNGQATLWESLHVIDGQEDRLISQFKQAVDEPYRRILNTLKKRKPDLSSLSRQYQQVLAQDYFQSRLGRKVRSALLAAKGATER